MVTVFVLKNVIRTGNYLILIRPLHLTTLAFVKEKNNGFALIDKKHAFLFIQSILSSFCPEQILPAAPLKIVPTGTIFVKSQQTIRIFFSTLTTRYSFVISVTFTSKTVPGVVWNADTFFTARVQFARLADTL